MFKKILKMATLMTTVSFGALAKAQEFLPGAKDIMDALILLEEMSKEDCANIIQNQESNDWMQDVTPLNATLETLENNVDNPSLVSTGIDLDEETEKLIAELSREQNEKFTVSSDNPYVFKEAVPEIPESSLSELQGIIQEEKSEIADIPEVVSQTNEVQAVQIETSTNSLPNEAEKAEKISEISQETSYPTQEDDADQDEDHSKNFLWFLALLATVPGIYYLTNKLERNSEQKWKEKLKSMKLDFQTKSAAISGAQKESNLTTKPLIVNIQVDPTNELEQRQKGVRLLANNKAKRALLTKQKKALMNEYTNPDISEVRKAEIDAVLDSIAAERKKLSQERRQACALFKGKKGEVLNEQRRLYTKKMKQLRRLMQKDGLPHLEEIAEINAARQALKEAEKCLMNEAKEEIKERSEKAGWLHGVRSLIEIQTKQKVFDQRIADLKKEKGLKKKEVLLSDFNLYTQDKQLKKEKASALRLIKGRSFSSQKLFLTKQLKMALAEQNTILANEISQKYIAVKQAEKDFIDKAKQFDYTARRIYMLNSKTAQRIQEHRKQEKQLQDLQQQKKERLAKAQFLRGQRMLYHLAQGESTLVNGNKVTPQVYRNEALRLVGSQQRIDYPRQRASYLKKCVLADLYLNKRAKGLI